MGRKLAKTRPKQGARLADLRKSAGLSQYELADLVGEPQANIAFWERSDKPPRADALPKLAKVLGVDLDYFLSPESPKKLRRGGPVGKLRSLFDQASLLPRSQQNKIIDILTALLAHYTHNKLPLKKPSKP